MLVVYQESGHRSSALQVHLCLLFEASTCRGTQLHIRLLFAEQGPTHQNEPIDRPRQDAETYLINQTIDFD